MDNIEKEMNFRKFGQFLTNIKYPQSCSKIIETNAKNGVVAVATSNVKLFKDHTVKFKIISLYIYKDLRLRILGLMSHVTVVTRMAT